MNHLCIGCGVCAAVCTNGRIAMPFDNRLGFYRPNETLASCDKACGICEKVCPFVPENPSTAVLTHDLFAETEGMQHNDVLGYYLSTRVGYSVKHRLTSASGGLATWMLNALLESGKIDHVISVGPDEQSPTLFSFRICKNAEEIRACSGSCYQPVELSNVLLYVLNNDGRYAITVLPCMAKALRLAMRANSRLRRRITYILGLTCGQVKSWHFVNYIAEHFAGRQNPTSVQFRAKRPGRPANDFAFRFMYHEQHPKPWPEESGQQDCREIGWNDGINHVWCNRWFALEACDYCDDVFAECADAVFMDAWLPDYEKQWQGTSLMVTRNVEIEALLQKALISGSVKCEDIPFRNVLDSQEGVIFQKRVMAGCHYESARNALRIPKPRYKILAPDHHKVAFLKRNIRACLQQGSSKTALKMVAGLNSPWGWKLAKLYSLTPWLWRKKNSLM